MVKSIVSNRNFLLLLIGQFVSVIGDRISSAVFITISVAIINDITTSYQSSLLLGVQFIPLFLFGYFFGLLADNYKKKNLMIIADTGRILIVLLLLFFHESLTLLYLCVFLVGTFTAMFEPSRKSILPFLVPKNKLVFLNKVYALMEILAMVIGLGVGAFLLEIISINEALIFDMSTYIFSLVLILFIRYHDSNEKIEEKTDLMYSKHKLNNFFHELKGGFSYLKKTPNSLYVIINIVFFHFLAAGFFFSAITDFGIRTSGELGLKAGSSVSFALFLVAIGALFSPLVKKMLGNMKESVVSARVFYAGSLILLLAYLSVVLFPKDINILFFLFFFIGIITGLQYIRFLYLIHMNTEKKFMGRVVSIAEITISLTVVLGVVLGSLLNEVYTYKYGFLLVSVIYFLGYLSFKFSKNKIDW